MILNKFSVWVSTQVALHQKMANPWVLRKIVLPQHTDHAGVMWHGAYLHWLEEARVDALSKVGISYADISEIGYEMPVVNLNIKYINALKHGDEVILKSWLLDNIGAKFPWKTTFSKDNGKTSAEAIVSLVLLQRVEAGTRLLRKSPEHISKALNRLREGPKLTP